MIETMEMRLDRISAEAHERVITVPKIVMALRDLADWCDKHRGLAENITPGQFYVFTNTLDEFREATERLGGLRRKSASDNYFNATRDFGSGINVQITLSRHAACERVVVRTEHIEEAVIPAHEKEVVEWKCPPALLGFADD